MSCSNKQLCLFVFFPPPIAHRVHVARHVADEVSEVDGLQMHVVVDVDLVVVGEVEEDGHVGAGRARKEPRGEGADRLVELEAHGVPLPVKDVREPVPGARHELVGAVAVKVGAPDGEELVRHLHLPPLALGPKQPHGPVHRHERHQIQVLRGDHLGRLRRDAWPLVYDAKRKKNEATRKARQRHRYAGQAPAAE